MKDMKELFGKPEITTEEGRRDRCIIDLLYCGLSLDEILSLKLGDVNLSEHAVITAGKRIVPLPGCVVEMLRLYISNMALCPAATEKEIRERLDGYLPGVTPEIITEAFINDLQQAGAGAREIAFLLGTEVR